LLLWQPAIVFLLLCYTVCYVCLANKLSLSLSHALSSNSSNRLLSQGAFGIVTFNQGGI